MQKLRGIFLGTGTSQGVPVIACDCDVCQSTDFKDKRFRTSFYAELPEGNIVIDTGPDFRIQMLNNQITNVDAVLYTHEHKDHIAGMDDVRPFNFKSGKAMEIYASTNVQEALKREFYYAFSDNKYPGVPSVNLHNVTGEPFQLLGEEITPIAVMHYKLPVFGFKIRNLAYITDANYIAEKEKLKLQNLDCLVLNALRKEKHISHFNLEEALALIEELKPKKAYLTHISHLFGKHELEELDLPNNVKIAYDGLTVEF